MKKLLFRLIPTPGTFSAKAALWLICAVVAGIHSWTLTVAPYQAQTIAWAFPLLTVAPGLISALLLPGEWRHWYRWAAVLMLTYSSYAEFITPIVFVGTAWALHRAWVTERELPLKSLFSLSRARKTDPVPAAKDKPKTA